MLKTKHDYCKEIDDVVKRERRRKAIAITALAIAISVFCIAGAAIHWPLEEIVASLLAGT